MTRANATAIAMQYMRNLEPKVDLELVLLDDQTIKRDLGWVFFYNSMACVIDGGDQQPLVGNAPLIVDRDDGSVHVTDTAKPVEYYIQEYAQSK